MDKPAKTYYRRLLGVLFLRSSTNLIFWMTAFLSLLGQGISEVSTVQGFFLLPLITLLADLPAGAYADRMSCRAAMRISVTLDLAAFSFLGLAAFHPAFPFLGFGLKALANAFESGASSQLLFATAERLFGTSQGSKRSSIHVEITSRLASVTAGTGAAFLVGRYPLAPMMLAVALSACALLLLLLHLPEQEVQDRFEIIAQAAHELKRGLRTLVLPVFLPITLWVLADGWRSGTEGVTFFPYLKSLLATPEILGILPLIATGIRLPIAMMALYGKVPVPEAPGSASIFLFLGIALNVLLMTVFPRAEIAILLASINFGLYALRDIYQRHWLNQVVSKAQCGPVVLRSALSTANVSAQLLGTALLAWPWISSQRALLGMVLGGGGALVLLGWAVMGRKRARELGNLDF